MFVRARRSMQERDSPRSLTNAFKPPAMHISEGRQLNISGYSMMMGSEESLFCSQTIFAFGML